MLHNDDGEHLTWKIAPEQAGERIDKFITDSVDDGASRSQVQVWIAEQAVTVNNSLVKANYRIKENDVITFSPPAPDDEEITPENIPIDIIYEDNDVIIVNKQRGMVVHPALGHRSGTLVNALLYHCKDLSGINGDIRRGIVHRIDKDTSGLLMIAKNNEAHIALSEQLKERTVLRKYVAIVHGAMAHQVGSIDAPIGRDPQSRKLFTVTANNSKESITHFKVLELFDDFTLVELKLQTGRTHQIRVHMKFIEHPLVGDPVYGRSKGLTMDGQALHAVALGFHHPTTQKYMEFEAPIPADMEDVLERIKSR